MDLLVRVQYIVYVYSCLARSGRLSSPYAAASFGGKSRPRLGRHLGRDLLPYTGSQKSMERASLDGKPRPRSRRCVVIQNLGRGLPSWLSMFIHDGKPRPRFSPCSQSENSDSFCASLMFTLKTLLWNKYYTYRNNNVIMSRTWLKNNRKINAWTHSHICRHRNCFISIKRKDVEWFLARRTDIME